ncbi:putative RNase H-like nuclease [Sphingomonas insulae]|uniref:DUF429 domain-containing protein n=1 Tax=Sphingomonas insulae TaxID=424800 RepID=A0ABP3SQM9_9SPHN|nr:DUF429 domain-containing protein [Sphingomonas insulae]NIJ30061.1 putative RNase H-like nuclease [Sphingomonas insulae]
MNIPHRQRSDVVLGIDAAWTIGRPSGVALAVRTERGWTLRAVAPSYAHFLSPPSDRRHDRVPTGSAPDAAAMLAASERIAGAPVALVAIDMPMSLDPITGRRPSDNAIARAFGARQCSTHSPSVARPGPLSDDLRAGFAAAGYPLQTRDARGGGLIEVYPHPALVVLAKASRRLPYKAGNSAKYWPGEPIAVRRALLADQWRRIATLLGTQLGGVAEHLPPLVEPATSAARKAHEDMLDAIVCAWIGIAALSGRADPHGDDRSAIWVPRDDGTEPIVTG